MPPALGCAVVVDGAAAALGAGMVGADIFGAGAAGAVGLAGALAAAARCGSGAIAFTAVWQAGERFARFCFRQFSAGAPPVGTLEQ